MKETKKNQNTTPRGRIVLAAPAPSSASLIMSKCPTLGARERAKIPTSMKALPRKVKMRNFMAEYWRRPVPHIEMRKYMGSNSSSQKTKNRMKSREAKTPITAV